MVRINLPWGWLSIEHVPPSPTGEIEGILAEQLPRHVFYERG